jgi:hypothetical protein
MRRSEFRVRRARRVQQAISSSSVAAGVSGLSRRVTTRTDSAGIGSMIGSIASP